MDFSKFYEVAERELAIKCPRTLGMTFAQVGSTVSVVTNTQLRKFGFSSLIKTPIGVIDCKIPQGKKDLNFKIFKTDDFNQYSLSLNPLTSEDYAVTLGRKFGPVKFLVNYDSANRDTNGIIGFDKTSKGTTIITQAHYQFLLQKMNINPQMFDEFTFKVHSNEDFGFAFKYLVPKELLEYTAIYSFGFVSLGVLTQHPLKLSKKALKFSGYPASLKFLTLSNVNTAGMRFSIITDAIPNLAFGIRAEKDVKHPLFTSRFSVLANFTQQEDGEFSVNLSGCASARSERWGSIAVKADNAGSVVCCVDPTFDNMLMGHASVSFVPNRKGIYQTSYSFNVSCFNGLDTRERPFFETVSDYFSVFKSHFQSNPQKPRHFSFFK